MAIEEWVRDRVTGVPQELIPPVAENPKGSTGGSLPPEMVQTGQFPAAVTRLSGGAQVQPELQFAAYNSGDAFMGTCPDCGSQMEYAEGCVKCHVCGFSEGGEKTRAAL